MSEDKEKHSGIGKQFEDAVDAVDDLVSGAVNSAAKAASHLAGRSYVRARRLLHIPKPRASKPGSRPGISIDDLKDMEAQAQRVPITCIDYCEDWVKRNQVEDLDAFLAQPRPEGTEVRWIDIAGLSDPAAIRALMEKYKLHPLAIEDVFNVPQRPKLEMFSATNSNTHTPYTPSSSEDERAFIVARMIRMHKDQVVHEQISMFLGKGFLITIQEQPGDVWDPIRKRIEQDGSRLRQNDASYLVYALLDAVVDHCFPILEGYSERLEDMEEQVLEAGDEKLIHAIYGIKRELLLLSRQIWPMRELINVLQREECSCISEHSRLFLRDVYDHAMQALEVLETYRDLAGGLADTYHTIMGNRMNEVMKVLTIFATIFIPITFVAGVYGMNFDNMPELHKEWGYPAFWVIVSSVAGGMLIWFRKRKWL